MAKLACFLFLLALGQTFAARSSGGNSPDVVVRDFGFDSGRTSSASRGSSISSSRGSIWDDADDDFSTPKIQAWPGGIVPYEISSDISSTNAAALKRMFQDISDKTCVRFVPRTRSDKNYALIQSGNKCSAPLGMSTGSSSSKSSLLSSSSSSSTGTPSNIILGQSCFTTTRVARRIMNLLGIPHETSRPDRDDFVEINFSNLRPGYDKQVKQVARSAWLPGVLDVPYDLQSVTQYTDDDIAANTNNWAIRAKSRRNVQLGGDTFSSSDWAKIRKAYNCPSSSFSG
ncbi:hypothetical protein RvY_04440 [Ramazzottius varieornatus]|uniref:Metalloendopeptidase n=1 Tax=Ramazzottius varieornatus TaxID=947166 RepID=A0A1D1UYF1_RAMVA|nr:hypothetical protein RvY_04440 [Ramazzottius varieornatus]